MNDLQLGMWQSEKEEGSGLGKGEEAAEMFTESGKKVEDKSLRSLMLTIFRG